MPSHTLELLHEPAAFLSATRAHLAADPVLTTVIGSVTAHLQAMDEQGLPRGDHPRWWAVVRDEERQVVGVAMRTAPFAPHPLYVLPMPDDAALTLARVLHDRGEQVGGVNGALPAARVAAEESARLCGASVHVHEQLRLFELGDLVVPPAPSGRLRTAGPDDAELTLRWFQAFEAAAAEQAGRSGRHAIGESFSMDDILLRIEDGVVWLWEDEHGRPVHLTAANPPANGVARIGPVYTPTEHRGHGYASAAVAEVSRQHLERGVRCCLFADRANPTSTKVYEAIGYRPVADMVNLLIR